MARKKTVKKKRSNNEGTIVQLANGKWRAQISLGYKENGTRNRPSEVFNTQQEAIAWKNKMKVMAEEYGAESIVDTSGMFVPKYHQWLLNEKKGEVYSPQFKTIMRHYTNHIKPYFRKYKIKEMTKSVMQEFFRKLERAEVGRETRRKIKGELRQFFEAEYANSPMRNPVDGVKIETVKKVEEIDPQALLNQEEYKAVPKELRGRFLKALDEEKNSPFLKPLCYLMYFAGNRVGEALAYQWKDFNFERRFFFVYKSLTKEYEFDEQGEVIGTGKTVLKPPKSKEGIRPLPLLDILYEVMMEWYDYRKAQEKVSGLSFTGPDDYVFSTNQGKMRTEGGTYTIFRRFLVRHDLFQKGIHFHALRQTFSNSLFAEKSDEQLIEDIMGHADVSTTKKHYKSLQKFDSVQEAARHFNAIYRPKNEKYCAGEDVTFAPEGYMSEGEVIKITSKEAPIEAGASERKKSLSEILGELKEEFPDLYRLLRNAIESENQM